MVLVLLTSNVFRINKSKHFTLLDQINYLIKTLQTPVEVAKKLGMTVNMLMKARSMTSTTFGSEMLMKASEYVDIRKKTAILYDDVYIENALNEPNPSKNS